MNSSNKKWVVYPDKRRLVSGSTELKLEPIVCKVLLCLIEHNGQTVSKAYLMKHVWRDTIVTEHSLNKIISKLRKAFNDSPKNSKVIETISKKGYRLLIPIEIVNEQNNIGQKAKRNSSKKIFYGAVSILAIGFLIYLFYSNAPATGKESANLSVSNISAITTSKGVEVMPDFSSDGQQLAYVKYEEDFQSSNLHIQQINTNSVTEITNDPDFEFSPKFSPNDQHLAFYSLTRDGRSSICTISSKGKNRQEITEITTTIPKGLDWSPDGKKLVFTDFVPETQTYAIFMYDLEAHTQRQLTFPDTGMLGDEFPVFSPDGKRIAFIRRETKKITTIGIIDLSNVQNPAVSIRTDFELKRTNGLSWTTGGDGILYFAYAGGSYILKVNHLNGEKEQELYQITNNSFNKDPVISSDGRHMAFVQFDIVVNVYKANISPNGIVNKEVFIQSTRTDSNVNISGDGTDVLFSSNRSGFYNLWTSDNKAQGQTQITDIDQPNKIKAKWSPDASKIVFSLLEGSQQPVYIMEMPNGLPTKLVDHGLHPSFSADGEWIYFGDNSGEFSEIKKASLKNKEVVSTSLKTSNHAMEAHNGESLFFLKENQDGIWQKNEKEKEVKIIDAFRDDGQSNWTVTANGIYYILYDKSYTPSLYYYDFSKDSAHKINGLSKTAHFVMGMSIYDDEIYYTVSNESESDILVLELNYR